MKHTECKDCELSNSDCGYHFKMDGNINYDIASLSACDKYGNCEFFKPKAKPKGDLISRSELKKAINDFYDEFFDGCFSTALITYSKGVDEIIDNAPTVPQVTVFAENASKEEVADFKQELEKVLERPQGEWVIQRLQNGFDDVYCPFCNARPTRSEYGYYLRNNFCHECGADMRKGGKEE